MASDDSPIDPSDDTVEGSQPRGSSGAMPATIGRYRIRRQLGRGGFGIVYLAHDEQLDRPVAIKVAHSELISRMQDATFYLNEARIVAGLDHPNIVPVHDVGSTDEIPFYSVSKYIDGTDLSVKLRSGRVHWSYAAELVAKIAEALHFAHKQGLVHRDVKPANILLDREGKPHLVDFGLALREAAGEKESTYVGTPTYTSPEQSRGEGHRVDGRSDIFSLGVVFYEMLTGKRPFKAASREEVLRRVSSYEPRPPRQFDERIPKELERVCQKAMAKLASERYSSAHDMAEDLRHFLSNQPTSETVVLTDRPAVTNETSDTVAATNAPTNAPTDAPAPVSSAGHNTPPPSSIQQPPDSSRHSVLQIVPKGIRSFDGHDAAFFLELVPGPRDRNGLPEIVRFWKTRIEPTDAEETFAVGLIYGPSGCGKSSLVNAGLLPHLSPHVIAVLVEAAPGHTETRLRRAIQRKCPTLPAELSLTETIKSIRQGYGPGRDKKVLIVIDQFEQWLHTAPTTQESELVEALRQCDGGRVQCIVMVRDDFWMAVTQFMRRLEIRISEGENSAAVDLFPVSHAVRVLTAFGRAFGSLPADAQPLDADQKSFLRLAVEGLASDGKVICVRLALFAETMRNKQWSTKMLQEVGGAQGVGRSFLEETFDSPTAPPANRFHQRAARRVLRELLPESGTNIRQSTRTYDQLREVSAYKEDQDFDELLEILNSKVRLITPTDPEGFDQDADQAVASDQRYFQLTHDYLVHSLRDWLTQKQKETRRGRAELLLQERASQWKGKPRNRFLPSLSETVRIRLLTDADRWTDDQRAVMRQATKVHLRGVAGALCVLLLLATVAWRVRNQQQLMALESERARAKTIVEGLADAKIASASQIVDQPNFPRALAIPMLKENLADPQASDADKLRYALALRDDANAQAYLRERLLNVSEDEFPIVRDAIVPSEDLLQRLWTVVQSGQVDSLRFAACCALASYQPQDPRWEEAADFATNYLTAKVLSYRLAARIEQLHGASNYLVEPLLQQLANKQTENASSRQRAALVLAEFLRGDAKGIVGAILLADNSDQFRPLIESLAGDFEPSRDYLRRVLNEDPAAGPLPSDDDSRLRRRAIAAATLAHFGEFADVLPLLVASDDPSLRSFIGHFFAEIPIDSSGIIDLASDEQRDTSVLRMLIQALGSLDLKLIAQQRRDVLIPWMEQLHREHPDSGVHGMSGWALRQWGVEPLDYLSQLDEDGAIATANQEVQRLEQLYLAEQESRIGQQQWEQKLLERTDETLDSDWGLRVRLKFEKQKTLAITGTEATTQLKIDPQREFTSSLFGEAMHLKEDSSLDCGDLADLNGSQPFSYGCWFNNAGKRDFAGLVTRMSTAGKVNRGYDLWQNQGRVGMHLVHHEDLENHVGDNFIKVLTAKELAGGEWYQVMATYDGSRKASGVRLYVNGVEVESEVMSDCLSGEINASVPLMMGTRYGSYPFFGWVDDVRIYDRELSAQDTARVFQSGIQELAQIPAADRSTAQQDVLARAYAASVVDDRFLELQMARQKREKLQWRNRRWRVNSQQQTMVWLPADPEHDIPVPFAISACEITVKQWTQSPRAINGGLSADRTAAPSDECPMHEMSWHEAARYCNWLSQQDGIPETEWVYEADGTRIRENFRSLRGYRLPTHAEWKYACRAGSEQLYCFGSVNEIAGDYAWFLGNAGGHSHPVGSKLPNDFGIFDMHGNSWEWTLETIDNGLLLENPTNEKQLIVGGAFNSVLRNVQFHSQTSDPPGGRSFYHTFRVVRLLPPSP